VNQKPEGGQHKMNQTKQSNLKKRKHKCPTCNCREVEAAKQFEQTVMKPLEKALKDNPIILQPMDQDFEEPMDEDCF